MISLPRCDITQACGEDNVLLKPRVTIHLPRTQRAETGPRPRDSRSCLERARIAGVSDADREQHLQAENEALRAEVAAQASEIERLIRKALEIEKRLNKGSNNSSSPPSSDWS